MSFSIFHKDPEVPIDQFLRDNLLDLREKSGFLIIEKQVLIQKDMKKMQGKKNSRKRQEFNVSRSK